MKFILERKELLTALGVVRPAARRSTIPILSHVAISTFDKSVEFICTDLNMTLRAKTDCEVSRKGECTVSAKLLHELANSFTGEHIQFELDGKNQMLTITSAKSVYELGTLDFKEFPPMPKLKDPAEFDMDQPTLHALLARTSFCISKDESRYILCSSLLSVNGEDTIAVATDGHRLAMTQSEAKTKFKNRKEILLPTDAVGQLLQLLSRDEEKPKKVTIAITQNQAQFHIGDTVLVTKLIEGNYPNYQQVIPKVKPNDAIAVNREEFLGMVRRCSIIAEDVVVTIRKRSLTVEASNRKDLIGDAHETMAIDEGLEKPVRIKVRARYLEEPLSTVTAEEVLMFVNDALTPILLKTKGDPWLTVVMPLREAEAPAPAEQNPAEQTAPAASAK